MIYKLNDGSASCHIICNWQPQMRDKILNTPGLSDYFEQDFEDDTMENIDITPLKDNEKLKIHFDGVVISHTCKEWQLIYGQKQGIVAQSEY